MGAVGMNQGISVRGANENANRDQISVWSGKGRTVGVLRDVKLPQDHNRIFSEVPASSFVRRVYGVLEAVELRRSMKL